jgi:hypothetical protein
MIGHVCKTEDEPGQVLFTKLYWHQRASMKVLGTHVRCSLVLEQCLLLVERHAADAARISHEPRDSRSNVSAALHPRSKLQHSGMHTLAKA